MGSVVSDQGVKVFWNKRSMISYLMSEAMSGYSIFATNLDFDFFGLFGDCPRGFFRYMFRGSSLLKVDAFPDGYNENLSKRDFLDSMNYSKMSVFKLGEMFSLPKLNKPKCFTRFPRNKREREELQAYNIRDSEITLKFASWIQENVNRYNISLRPTIASCALSIWRRNFQDMITHHPSHRIMKQMRRGYYGGRVECFKRGLIKGKFNYYDVNSIYPYVMRGWFPKPDKLYIRHGNNHENLSRMGVSLAKVEIPHTEYYPLLPYRDPVSKKTIYPTGRIKGVYSHAELIRAKELKYKVQLIKSWIYPEKCRPFKGYVDHFYGMRKKHPESTLFWKLLLNSLYGKFAMKYDDSIEYRPMRELRHLPDSFIMERGGFALLNKKRDPAPYIVPIWSIYTTAYARIYLHKLISKHKAIYCDTDSLITKDIIKTDLELGGLKKEHSLQDALIIRPKFYRMVDRNLRSWIKAKGMRIYDDKSFFDLLDSGIHKYIRFTKFKESLRTKRKILSIYTQESHIDMDDDKRDYDSPFSPDREIDSKPRKVEDWDRW
jgi:hypothetical protein